ncbi:MAG TPA: FtsK/SpoIIIE domain-containing protein [Longimicrobiales bacterium]|nr:FtsK/SpoIIIE domain-containing protein [Longimicrobiales bacterium]
MAHDSTEARQGADAEREWAKTTTPLLGPAELVRVIAQLTNARIVTACEAALAAIDDEGRRAEAAAAELRRELDASLTPVREWLRERDDSRCVTDEECGAVRNCELNPGKALVKRFGNPFEEVDLPAACGAWTAYQQIPRKSEYEKLDGSAIAGSAFAGSAFVLLLLANLFTDGIGFFKMMYLLAILGGLFAVVISMVGKGALKDSILRAFDHARRLTTDASRKLGETAGRLESQIEAERSAIHQRLLEEEEALRRYYAQEVEAAEGAFDRARAAAGIFGLEADRTAWSTWEPVAQPISFLRIGELVAPTPELDARLKPPITLSHLPALVPFAPGRGLCMTGSANAKPVVMAAIQSLALRLVAGIPPGKLRFVFIDPVGLGHNVAPLLALGDHVEELIGGRAWSEPSHIEQRLAELTQHMETVIQKYLRNEHKNIESYNASAGQVVEAYRILIVCDFPVNFTEASARRLISIALNGPRCGVYPFIVVHSDRPMPYGVSLEALTAHLTCIRDGGSAWSDVDFGSWSLALDGAPSSEMFQHVTKAHGELAEMGMRVSVPFGDLVAHAGLSLQTWRDDGLDTSTDQLTVPLGQSGVRKYQDLMFGKGTAHHALVVGQTGSGKSNLLHAMITMLALRYSPDELELYLVDFKQGVEFKLYAETALPHARVIAIQSEREFGLSVLRGLLAEMDRRGDLFREAGVPSLGDWRRRSGQALPRILLLVDEFRVFFTADDTIASEATMIIDRLVSQGRAFGIHVVLASQTLGGSYTLPRSITDQMAVRVVLQCTEADSRLALADDNPEARLLSRPGEAIYNDQRGLIEGNHRFQVADMGDDEARASIVREYLAPRVDAWPKELRRPIVFEGHRPARLEESVPLTAALDRTDWSVLPRFVDVWLGEPISLRPSTAVRFLRQGGANLLMVMRDEAQAVTLMQVAMVTLAAQLSPRVAGFHVVDMSSVDAAWAGSIDRLATELPHRKNIVGRRGLGATLDSVGQELERRLKSDTPTAESIFILFVGLHRMHDLREDDGIGWCGEDTRPDVRRTFAKILREGPELGIHSLVWADSQSSAARVFDRQMLGDFGRRIVGSMSEQDSLALIDEPLAGHLAKPHRLIRFDEDRPGDLETFRPYAASEPNWLIDAAQRLALRAT